MTVKVLVPGKVFYHREVTKVTAEAENGAFGLLPRHVDFVTSLVPGLLGVVLPDGDEEYLAVDRGILAKTGAEVRVAVADAVRGPDLGELERTVRQRFRIVDDQEKRTRAALARLEADFVRRFLELQE